MIVDPYESGSALGWTSAITGAVTGVSNTILNYMDAFCATEACDQARQERETKVEVATLQKQAAQQQTIAAGIAYKQSQARQQTILLLGAGALGLGAVYILTR